MKNPEILTFLKTYQRLVKINGEDSHDVKFFRHDYDNYIEFLVTRQNILRETGVEDIEVSVVLSIIKNRLYDICHDRSSEPQMVKFSAYLG